MTREGTAGKGRGVTCAGRREEVTREVAAGREGTADPTAHGFVRHTVRRAVLCRSSVHMLPGWTGCTGVVQRDIATSVAG